MVKCSKCTKQIELDHFQYWGKRCLIIVEIYKYLFDIIINGYDPVKHDELFHSFDGRTLLSCSKRVLLSKKISGLNKSKLNLLLKNDDNFKSAIKEKKRKIYCLLTIISQVNVIKSILVNGPDRLEKIDAILKYKFKNLFNESRLLTEIEKIALHIFDYDHFSRNGTWNTSKLKNKLSIKSCLYCNLQSLDKAHSLDHFLNQENFPYFSVSLYNLIPSCFSCNTGFKLSKTFSIQSHIHPYFKDYLNDYNFALGRLNPLRDSSNNPQYYFFVDLKNCMSNKEKKIVKNSLGTFRILSRSRRFQKLFDPVVKILWDYDEEGLKSIIMMIKNFGGSLTVEEVYEYLFSKSSNSSMFSESIYSRMTFDVVKSEGKLDLISKIVSGA